MEERLWTGLQCASVWPCIVSLPDFPKPPLQQLMTVPQAASLCAAQTWEATEIVYTLQTLVLLEDSQYKGLRAERLLKWGDHKAHLGCIHHQKNPNHQTVITSNQC